MNILITGGNGFIAKTLKEKLSNYNIFAPVKNELNILDESLLKEYIYNNEIDIIIHTANIGGYENKLDEKETFQSNLKMFLNVANQSKNVKKIIHLGSGAEYSKDRPIVKVDELDSLKSLPNDDYGLYKSICSRFIEQSENIINLRIFGCYGEYEDYNYKFISNSILKNLLEQPIIINQNVLFDYIYVDDLIKMIEYFIINENKYKVYNVSRGESIDLVSICKIINSIGSFNSEIKVLKEGLNNEYTSNNNRFIDEVSSFNFTTHEKAIFNMYKYFENNLSKIDKSKILEDKYLQKCNNIWIEGKNENC
ncbi:NAD-dependent epimerase/dehydratase family protein [Arcobacter sp. LA11]|uniref:NAD-dependent epimerase/dehydratase family protein n=1 Tax=Arcobacter sp. LA11 TaxID=1898176 RepID=UPI0009347C2B|nr:NAD-dependent epimerase/dehydratase family protein [Arcobacter sp. LA11]